MKKRSPRRAARDGSRLAAPAKPASSGRFHFAQYDTIGAEDARHDTQFLHDCFIYTPHFDIIADPGNPRRIVIGRTGAGKSALLLKLKNDKDKVFEIEPETLAFNYIANSTILRYLLENGIKLDNFFKLLWRHVFAVEIIKNKYGLTSEQGQLNWVKTLQYSFKNMKHINAINYFIQRGGTFWQETDFRVREIVSNFENEVASSLGTNTAHLSAKLASREKLSEEEKTDVTHRSKDVINKVQMRELGDMIDTINYILDDQKEPYYIVIDRLDESWVDDSFRYFLIRALIETVRDFQRVRNLKIIVALRYDLIGRVFNRTRDAGFQEEKYKQLYLDLTWTDEQLTDVLDARITQLVRMRYSPRAEINHKVVLPKLRGARNRAAIQYMLERTFMRPRDIISFFNCCLMEAAGSDKITLAMLKTAEGIYSEERLTSLQYEWITDYKNLRAFAECLLRNVKFRFTVDDFDDTKCQDIALDLVGANEPREDPLVSACYSLVDERISLLDFKLFILNVFYMVGLVGLKKTTSDKFTYITGGPRSISKPEITKRTLAEVHPIFWRVFGIRDVYRDMHGKTGLTV